MNHYDLTPNAAERYFNASIFGQLYTLMAEALGRRPRPARPADARSGAATVAPTARGPGLLDRLDRWFWQQEQKARDDYLATSADVFELERRIKALERGSITRYY
jgi:hypothetical protein